MITPYAFRKIVSEASLAYILSQALTVTDVGKDLNLVDYKEIGESDVLLIYRHLLPIFVRLFVGENRPAT